MNPRRPVVVLAALAALAAPLVVGGAAVGSRGQDDLATETIQGADGETYDKAPTVVTGRKGDLYFGYELDYACTLGGEMLSRWTDRMAKLVRVLEKSGRTVVYSIAPGKTWGLTDHLDKSSLPHGSCDRVGVAQQNAVLDQKRSSYLPIRPLLADRKRQMYWKTDPHWTTVGAAAYARGVAHRLDPELGRQQHYAYTTEARWGNISEALGDPTLEIGERAIPDNGVKVRTARDGVDWAGYPTVTFDHAWTSAPRAKTWPGRTVLIGDSFMWYALESLRPVFRHGHFIWLGKVPVDELIDSIVRADTVVLESYAPFGSPFSSPIFRRVVKTALAESETTRTARSAR